MVFLMWVDAYEIPHVNGCIFYSSCGWVHLIFHMWIDVYDIPHVDEYICYSSCGWIHIICLQSQDFKSRCLQIEMKENGKTAFQVGFLRFI